MESLFVLNLIVLAVVMGLLLTDMDSKNTKDGLDNLKPGKKDKTNNDAET